MSRTKCIQAKSIALVDFVVGGHNASYLARYASAFSELGCKVATVCPSELSELTKQIADISLRQFPFQRPKTSLSFFRRDRKQRRRSAMFRRITRQVENAESQLGGRFDLVIVMCVFEEDYRAVADFVDSIDRPTAVILMHPRILIEQASVGDRAGLSDDAKALFSRPNLHRVLTLHEEVAAWLKFRVEAEVVAAPDIAWTDWSGNSTVARDLRKRADGRKVVGLMGKLDARKGLKLLVETADLIDPRKYLVAIIGELNWKNLDSSLQVSLQACQNQPDRFFFHSKRVRTESEYNAILRAGDVLFCCYDDFPFSSNTLTKAAYFRVPVVVLPGHLMARRTQKYSLGVVAEAATPGSIAAAIESIDFGSPTAKHFEEGCTDYFKQHGPQQFQDMLSKFVQVPAAKHKA